jgi:uncharacterized protein HemX
MIKLYLMLIVLAILGSVGYGAVWYYNDTQQRIATLRENNAKLEVAVETAEQSMNTMKDEMARNQELMNQLSAKLQKAEAYGDDLRNKLRQLDLVQDAIKDAVKLEGKMNGATAKLWRSIVADTGGTPDPNLPEWLQPVQSTTGTESPSSDQGGENNSTDGIPAEASTTN